MSIAVYVCLIINVHSVTYDIVNRALKPSDMIHLSKEPRNRSTGNYTMPELVKITLNRHNGGTIKLIYVC